MSKSMPPVRSLRDVIQHFTPAWFSINMGTGVVSALLHSYPYGGGNKILNAFALGFFFLNLTLFCIFLFLTICRYVMFPHLWGLMLRHPVQSLYLGCFPMGAVTLVNVGLTVVNQYWGFGGTRFLYVLWSFWWLDVLVSFLCCFGLAYVMTAHQQHSMSTFTPVWLLPVVTLIVASSTGQLLTTALIEHSLKHALITLGFSVVMVIIGISLSLMILTVYIRRLFIDGLPDVGAIISSFLPLGPYGQAGYSLLLAGQNLRRLLPRGNGNVLNDELVGHFLNVLCFAAAYILWCMAAWWLISAVIAIIHTIANGQRLAFKLPFWGLVFPNGVAALLTIQLATAMDSDAFRLMGAIYAAAVIMIWLLLAGPTLVQVYDKRLFLAPCLLEELSRAKGLVGADAKESENSEKS